MASSTPAYVAKVKDLAGSQSSQHSENAMVGRDVLERIQNCLKRAEHPKTPEAEAHTAFRMASRLMVKYNVSQAEVIAAEVDSDESSHRAGQSTVSVSKTEANAKTITTSWLDKNAMALEEEFEGSISFEACKQLLKKAVEIARPSEKVNDRTWLAHIIRMLDEENVVIEAHKSCGCLLQYIVDAFFETEPTKAVKGERWSDILSEAMTVFFDCKCYTVSESASRDWVFYGIGVNAVAAAMSFEMAFNLVEHWVLSLKSGKPSYRLGVADGVLRIARGEKQDELRRAQEQEAASAAATEQSTALNQNEMSSRCLNESTAPATQSNPSETEGGSKKTDTRVKLEDTDDISMKVESEDSDTLTALERAIRARYDGDDAEDYDNDDASQMNAADTQNDASDDNEEYPGLASTFVTKTEKPIDLSADLDEELLHHMPQRMAPKPDPSPEPSNEPNRDADRAQRISDKESGMLWRDRGALTLYRKNATKIAEDYLKDQKLKMRKGRKRTARARDPVAYNKGREDSKKIDVKRRRIQGKEDEEM